MCITIQTRDPRSTDLRFDDIIINNNYSLAILKRSVNKFIKKHE